MEPTPGSRPPLQPGLEPQLAVAEQRYPQALQLLTDYDTASYNGDEAGVAAAVTQLSALTGKAVSEGDLFEYYEAGSKEEQAFRLSLPLPVKVSDITPSEVAEITYRLTKPFEEPVKERSQLTFAEQASLHLAAYYHDLLQLNVPEHYSYKLFTRQKAKDGTSYELTPAEIIARLLA